VYELGEKNWRRAREDMEHEKYLELRRLNQKLASPLPESKLREEARKHANDSCRMAIRIRNEQAVA
jgi:hypothetical protein